MKLTTELGLRRIVATLNERVAPAIEDDYIRNSVRLAGTYLTILAEGIDDLAVRPLDEAMRIRAIFAEAAPLVADPDLRRRLEQEAQNEPASLKISLLEEESDRLRRLLIELHAFVEIQEGEAFAAIDRKIWGLLADLEEQRKVRS